MVSRCILVAILASLALINSVNAQGLSDIISNPIYQPFISKVRQYTHPILASRMILTSHLGDVPTQRLVPP